MKEVLLSPGPTSNFRDIHVKQRGNVFTLIFFAESPASAGTGHGNSICLIRFWRVRDVHSTSNPTASL